MRDGALLDSSIGDYRLVNFVGAGGMGEVYRAVHSKIDRVVAIKVLSRSLHGDGGNARFINEARLHARLYHPQIATLFDFIESGGHQCIVMEYVDGQTLDALIESSGSINCTEALRIFEAVVEAVGYVHDHSIIHRDIKPHNIKVTANGEVKLLDFGIAKANSSPNLTLAGNVIGTLKYLSPEQLARGVADARSDIWALGILLHEMLTGQVPFAADTLGEILAEVNSGKFVPASSLNFAVPRELDAIVSRCLQKNPLNRYGSAEQLLRDIRQLRSFNSEEPPSRVPLYSKVNQRQILFALGVLLIAVIPIAYFVTVDSSVLPSTPSSAVVLPAGTQASRENGDLRSVRIQAMDGEAEVYQGDQRLGVTPYDLEAPLGKQVQLVLKRNGFADKRVEFSISENRTEYNFTLDTLSEP